MICHRDYADRVFASFPHQIQSEYYCVNISVYIEGIALENLSALPEIGINSSTQSYPSHSVFHYFLSDGRKKYSAKTTSHIKH